MLFTESDFVPPAGDTFSPVPTEDFVRVIAVRKNHRKIPLSRARHVIGTFSPRPGHPRVDFESLLERSALIALARLPECLSVMSQPFTIDYEYRNRSYRYTPDILVVLKPVPHSLLLGGFRKYTAIEVKPDDRACLWKGRLPQRREAVLRGMQMPLIVLGEKAIAGLKGSKHHGS